MTYIGDYETIRVLVELARVAFQSEHGELVVNYDPPLALTVGSQGGDLLGLSSTFTRSRNTGDLPEKHPSCRTYAVVPLGPIDAAQGPDGPGAPSGWLAIAGSPSKPFDGETLEGLEAVVRCIAIALERAGASTTVSRMRDELNRLQDANDRLERESGSAREHIDQLAYLAAHELQDPHTGHCDLNVVVEAALASLSDLLVAADCVVSVGALPEVEAKPRQLQSVFFAIVSNSLRFRRADEHLRVAIAAERLGDDVLVTVSDNGATAGRGGRLFEQSQGRSSGSDDYGVALTLSRRMVEAVGGKMGVRAAGGTGATFWIRLPLARQKSSDRLAFAMGHRGSDESSAGCE